MVATHGSPTLIHTKNVQPPKRTTEGIRPACFFEPSPKAFGRPSFLSHPNQHGFCPARKSRPRGPYPYIDPLGALGSHGGAGGGGLRRFESGKGYVLNMDVACDGATCQDDLTGQPLDPKVVLEARQK